MIRDIVLSLETETITESEIGTDTPIVQGVQAGVKPTHPNSRIPRGTGAHRIIGRPVAAINQVLNSLSIRQAHHQLLVCLDSRERPAGARTGCAWGRSDSGSERKVPIEIGGIEVFVVVRAHPYAKLHEMFAHGHGSVVLELVPIESVIKHALNTAAGSKCALHLNRGSGADGRLNCGRPKELEAGFVDDLGVHNLGIADLQSMFRVDDVETLISQVELPGACVFVRVVQIMVT